MRRTTMMVALVSAAIALCACTKNAATGRMQLNRYSTDEEIRLGTEAKPELVKEYGGEVQSPQLRAYVDRVGRSMVPHTEGDGPSLPWEFTVLDSDVINAFALPGGKVFISRGLLARFNNEAQVAGVLGHEIGHVIAQHVDERMSQALGWNVLVAGVGIGTDSQVAVAVANLFSQGYQLKFGRDQERESDVLGVRYMAAAGYDPHGMLEVLDVLREAGGRGGQPEFLSTHPHPETRLKTVNELLAGPYRHTQGNPRFQKFADRFQRDVKPHLP
jgi:predicted Zn-dependent protease